MQRPSQANRFTNKHTQINHTQRHAHSDTTTTHITMTMPPLRVLYCMVLLFVVCVPLYVVGVGCVDPSPLSIGSSVRIALLVWVSDAPPGPVADITNTRATQEGGYGTSFMQPYMLGLDLYVESMRSRGPLPLQNGESTTLDFVYINMANGPLYFEAPDQGLFYDSATWDYSDSKTVNGYPLFMYVSTEPSLPGSFFYPGLGFLSRVLSTDPNVLMATFGFTEPFTFIVLPPLLLTAPTIYLANLVESSQSHILIHSFLGDQEAFRCDGIMNVSESTTPDCITRGLKEDGRRFQTLFSTIFDTSTSQYAALEHFHTLRVKKMILIHEPPFSGSNTQAYWSSQAIKQQAKQLNIQLTAYSLILSPVGCTDPWCAPLDIQARGQTLTFDQKSPMEVALEIKAIGADAMIIAGSPTSGGGWSVGQLFECFQSIDWTPGAVSYGGGFESQVVQFLPNGLLDLRWTWNTKPWDPLLSGPNYRNLGSASDFQLFPATEEEDSPAAFSNAYEKKYGPMREGGNGTAHPFYSSPLKLNSLPAIGFATLERVQKMIEFSSSRDVGTILGTTKGISRPGMYSMVQFDVYGRTLRTNEVLQQMMPSGELNILAPYNLAAETVYPIPTWEEREFKPEFYSETNERVMLAINSLCLVLLCLLLAIVLWYHDAPVIRASTPSFCVCISLGCMLMVGSNFFATLHVDDSHCAASTWLLTCGFTLTFAAIFVKTFRILRIFGGKRLLVSRLRDWELFIAVCCFVMIDVIINVVWTVTVGMGSKRVTVDPIRPRYDYMTCDYGDGAMIAVYVHLAIKGFLLLIGVGITIAVRNTPSQFNESTLIGLAIYNLTVCGAFGVPIVGVGLGGRHTTYLLRCYLLMFISLSVSCLLYLPKLILIARKKPGTTNINRITKIGGKSTIANESQVGGSPTAAGGVAPSPTAIQVGEIRRSQVGQSPKGQPYSPADQSPENHDPDSQPSSPSPAQLDAPQRSSSSNHAFRQQVLIHAAIPPGATGPVTSGTNGALLHATTPPRIRQPSPRRSPIATSMRFPPSPPPIDERDMAMATNSPAGRYRIPARYDNSTATTSTHTTATGSTQ